VISFEVLGGNVIATRPHLFCAQQIPQGKHTTFQIAHQIARAMGPALAQHFTRERTKTPPYDISFHPNNPNHHSHEYNTIGLDITIANAKKPLPSTQNLASSEDCITTLTANADTFLQDFERRKLNRSNNTRANPPIPGKAVIGDLLRSQRLLIP
jgi:hypothetical protein